MSPSSKKALRVDVIVNSYEFSLVLLACLVAWIYIDEGQPLILGEPNPKQAPKKNSFYRPQVKQLGNHHNPSKPDYLVFPSICASPFSGVLTQCCPESIFDSAFLRLLSGQRARPKDCKVVTKISYTRFFGEDPLQPGHLYT